MELKEIAAISGKPGLYKILKSTPKGVIVETLDAQKKRLSVGINHRVSILKEISIYTTTEEGTESLAQALHNIHQLYKGEIPVDKKSEEKELRVFMKEIVPEYDIDRVFYADMKKLVSWYSILFEFVPEIFDNLLTTENPESEATTEEENPEAAVAENDEVAENPEMEANADTEATEAPTEETHEEAVQAEDTTPAESVDAATPKKKPTKTKKNTKE